MHSLIFTIVIVGLSGIVAQVIILRELLLSFYGNELVLGIILANWVAIEAVGVFIFGRYIDKAKDKAKAFVTLQIVFSLALPLSIYFARSFKSLCGIPLAEGLTLPMIFLFSFLALLPSAFCHGALFSSGCSIYSSREPHSIGKIYAWETIGTILGGIILTYFFIARLNSFQTTFTIAAVNLITCLFFLKRVGGILRYFVLTLIALIVFLFLGGGINHLNKASINRQLGQGEILEYRNSVYGNIAVVQKEKQRTFFYNGLPIITSPYPDIIFTDEFGHLPLLFHPSPKDALIISGGLGGLINKIAEHPLKKIDYTEKDKLIIDTYREYAPAPELNDRRLNIINLDGRSFLNSTPCRYDVILVGISCPQDLSSNRFFTREFFALAKQRLNKAGILALTLPGSSSYLSRELRDLNNCVLNSLRESFKYARVIPGDYNLILASSSGEIMEASPPLLAERISQLNIKSRLLSAGYLDYRLDKKWMDWFERSSVGATSNTNEDFTPFAVFQMLTYWNKQFSTAFAPLYEASRNLNLKAIFMLTIGATLAIFLTYRKKTGFKKAAITYSIAATGFFGMLINLILIFSFQIFYGYLYQAIGLLLSIFMAGTAAGSILAFYRAYDFKNSMRLFIILEIIIIVFTYLAGFVIPGLTAPLSRLPLIFMLFGFIPGFFLGLAFALASKIYPENKDKAGSVSGALYCSDLIGGCLAGILGGIVFLPILGLFKTCMVIVILKLSSCLLLLAANKNSS